MNAQTNPTEPHSGETAPDIPDFSLMRGGPLRRMGPLLATPVTGPLRAARRAGILALLTWLPLALLALWEGRALVTQWGDPLSRHFSIHVQLLLALPLLVIGEMVAEPVLRWVLRGFTITGIVDSSNGAEFRNALERAQRLRDSKWGVVFVAVLVAVRLAFSLALLGRIGAMSWAQNPPDTSLSGAPIAAWWYLIVCRSVMTALFAAWAWRLLVAWALFHWISKVDLKLVPTHPDQLAGLGFLQRATMAAVPVVFTLGALIAAPLGREVLDGGASVKGLPLPIAIFVGAVLVVALGPMMQFAGRLKRLKRQGLLEYGALVARQGNLVRRKWIGGEDVGDAPVLDAPELGPVADTGAMYDAVARMKTVPMGKQAVLPLVVAALLPFVPVLAQAMPLKEAVLKLLGVLF